MVGELAYKPIAMTQFRPFVVNGWFIQGRSHVYAQILLCCDGAHEGLSYYTISIGYGQSVTTMVQYVCYPT